MEREPDELNWIQRYAASEVVEYAQSGRLSRREMLQRLAAICGSAAAGAAFLAACSSAEKSATSTAPGTGSSSTTQPQPGSTVETPPTTAGSGATLSVAADDPAVKAGDVSFPGPAGMVLGYRARPAAGGPRAGIIVIHEIFGLNDHIRDVTRRVAKAGHLAVAVDLASRAGGSERADDVIAAITRGPVEDRIADLNASVAFLERQTEYDGKLGVVGFCFGGGMTLSFAAAQPMVRAAVPYYGPTPEPASAMRETEAAVLAQYGEQDTRVNGGIAALESAMTGKTFEKRVHAGAGHAFNNDTGPAYNEKVAVEAWTATLGWFAEHLAT